MSVGAGAFRSRPPVDDDPVVCNDPGGGCGATLGIRRYLDTPEKVAAREREHAPEHVARLAHQRRHATYPGPCPDCRWHATPEGHDANGRLL